MLAKSTLTLLPAWLAAVCLCACEAYDADGFSIFAGSTDRPVSVELCKTQCALQQSVSNCTTLLTLSTCEAVCAEIAAALPVGCGDEYNTYFRCAGMNGFVCVDGLVSQASSTCNAALNALDACTKAGAAGSGGEPVCGGAVPCT